MFRYSTSIFMAFAVLVVAVSAAQATVYKCTEAKEEAVLGVDSAVSSNHGNGRCRWSVNGASIDMRPDSRSRHINLLNAFISGSFDHLSRGSSQIEQLVVLLLGPFSQSDISSSTARHVGSIINSYADGIGRCIAGDDGRVVSTNDVVCDRISPARSGDRPVDVWRIQVMSSEPVLVVGVRVDDQRFMLFLPVRYKTQRFHLR